MLSYVPTDGAKERPRTDSEEMERKLALTRKLLEGMGIEEKQVETIIEAHSETVNALKAEMDKHKEQADKVPDLQRQLEEAKANAESGGDWEKKFNDEHEAFENFKAKVDADKAEQAKAKAYREMLVGANIDPKRIDAIMRVTDLSGVEMEDGKLKDAEELAKSAKEEWSDFVLKQRTEGAGTETPPENNGGADGGDPEVAERMQERHDRLFGKTEE